MKINKYSYKYNHYVTYFWLIKQFNIQDQSNIQIGGRSNKKKWTTFIHNGVLFPPEYIPHDIPIIYNNNQKVYLSPEAEEMATIFSKYTDTDYIKNKVFTKNFWKDWKNILGKDNTIQSLELCNFSLIYNHLLEEKERKKNMSKEEKEEIKREKEEMEKKYKTAYIDGKPQPVGNFRVEPPGIFIGRGCHPKLGKIKRRIYPEDVTLNLSKNAPVPETLEGHKWGSIIHDQNVEWLASWKDEITGKIKYVWLAAHSDLKAESDKNKYELARKLKRNIKKIREENDKNLQSSDLATRQIATALYFIDNLALRVGNEKGEDEADTVGVTSLRVEHVKLSDNNTITLDFLGKDSVPYHNTVQVPPQVYQNLKEFMDNKNLDDPLFDKINSNDVNKYLQNFMKGLSAKIFRTMSASNLFQKELNKITKKYDGIDISDKINILLDEFNRANAKVAVLCNHQKNISKNFNDQVDKINEKIKNIKKKISKAKKDKNKEKIKKLENDLQKLKVKKDLKIEMKNISTSTSKHNYIDSRITISFMKKHNLPIDKIFNKALQERFKWAFDVGPDWQF